MLFFFLFLSGRTKSRHRSGVTRWGEGQGPGGSNILATLTAQGSQGVHYLRAAIAFMHTLYSAGEYFRHVWSVLRDSAQDDFICTYYYSHCIRPIQLLSLLCFLHSSVATATRLHTHGNSRRLRFKQKSPAPTVTAKPARCGLQYNTSKSTPRRASEGEGEGEMHFFFFFILLDSFIHSVPPMRMTLRREHEHEHERTPTRLSFSTVIGQVGGLRFCERLCGE